MRRHHLAAAALLLASVAAWAKDPPKYKTPTVTVPANWQAPAPWREAAPADAFAKGEWWKIFNDPELIKYEEQALANNQTIAGAVARLSEARAFARVTQAGLYPELDTGFSAQRSRVSANRPLASQPPTAVTYNTFTIPFTLNYEVDLFGGIRSSVQAARASLQASAADLENFRLLITSELAADYFQVRSLDAEIEVVKEAIDYQQKGLDLVNHRHEGGVASGLDVAQQATVLDSSTTQLSLLIQQRAQFEHAVAVLQGLPASQFNVPYRALKEEPPAVPLLVPSDLLERRPDIAKAERLVLAANAQIGVAHAALFPSIAIGAGGGAQSINISSLLNGPSAFWSIAANVFQPVFAGGKNRARVDLARASYQESVANYRETVLDSFQQVEDALSGLNALAAASNSQTRAVADSQRALDLANNRYQGGLTTYLDVITAQETLLVNQRLSAQLLGQRLVTSVLLVKALGGGWDKASLDAVKAPLNWKTTFQQ